MRHSENALMFLENCSFRIYFVYSNLSSRGQKIQYHMNVTDVRELVLDTSGICEQHSELP